MHINLSLALLTMMLVFGCQDPKRQNKESIPSSTNSGFKISIDEAISATDKEYINLDFKFLESQKFDLTPLQKLDVKAFTGEEFENFTEIKAWLEQRLHFIVNADQYTTRVALINAPKKTISPALIKNVLSSGTENTRASNAGITLFQYGEFVKSQLDFNYLVVEINRAWVHILSPRVGILKLGSLFAADNTVGSSLKSTGSTIHRLSIIFHEARHTDGNAKAGTLGMLHKMCPSNSSVPTELWGIHACDDSINGPYMIGATITKLLLSQCKTCSTVEKTILEARILDEKSRIMSDKIADASPHTEYKRVAIDKFKELEIED